MRGCNMLSKAPLRANRGPQPRRIISIIFLRMTKVLLLNLPGGRAPTDYPPVAVSRVIEGLDPALGCEAYFLNNDLLRPSFEEILAKCREFKPQVIGFSAILTPTYKYLKDLSLFLKKEYPAAVQVLGGEMSAIHHLVLRGSAVDFCVLGQSEPAFSSLIAALQKRGFDISDKAAFRAIPGLAFLDAGELRLTGEQAAHGANATRQINYALLSRFTDIGQYIHAVGGRYYRDRINPGEIDGFFSLFRKENLARNLATVFSSKGCVGRCSFCHRFFKGYQVIDFEAVTGYIKELAQEHNVGMVLFQVEDFGSDAAATDRLVDFLKTTGLNWAAPAVRARTAKDEVFRKWKEAGCVNVNFGIESGSQKMLDVMDKMTKVEENLAAIRLCNKHRLATIISLLIGMPGETEETIEETIASLSTVIPDDMDLVYEISINFYQAVPCTQGYDFARLTGLIGTSPEEEERYIEGLHEAAANEIGHYLNFTDYEKEEVLYWKDYIVLELLSAYLKKHGVIAVLRRKRLKRFYYAALYRLLPKPVRKFLLKYLIIIKHFGIGSLPGLLRRKFFSPRPRRFALADRPLRLINQDLREGKPWPSA
jgi:anaerobic magnesium-protoporphyrin IX monomethyl ester cyclase